MTTHPADQISAQELARNERALYEQELNADWCYGTEADYEWWVRQVIPYSALRVHVLASCPSPGYVTVVVKLRPHTNGHRRRSIQRVLENWLEERSPVTHLVAVHLVVG